MRHLCIFFLLLFFSALITNAQDVRAENLPKKHTEKVQSIEQPSPEDVSHKYICQRCGTENLIEWSSGGLDKQVDLIPHCTFCGKKYWPKFKPSGFLQRTFCSLETGILSSESQSRL